MLISLIPSREILLLLVITAELDFFLLNNSGTILPLWSRIFQNLWIFFLIKSFLFLQIFHAGNGIFRNWSMNLSGNSYSFSLHPDLHDWVEPKQLSCTQKWQREQIDFLPFLFFFYWCVNFWSQEGHFEFLLVASPKGLKIGSRIRYLNAKEAIEPYLLVI